MQNNVNQTSKNSAENRDEDIRKDLPAEICSIWLGRSVKLRTPPPLSL